MPTNSSIEKIFHVYKAEDSKCGALFLHIGAPNIEEVYADIEAKDSNNH